MSEPAIRAMVVGDIPIVAEIEKESFTLPWSAEAFRTELVHNRFAHYSVLEQDGQIIGYGGMWVIADEAHVTNIALREPFRGRGLGELLLRSLMEEARSKGAARMTLEVRVSNERAQRLYRKLGFVSHGVRPGYYTDNAEDALIMWADLPSEPVASAEPNSGEKGTGDCGGG
jgi:ribosomal-protein-alanine N-acetyltransferase